MSQNHTPLDNEFDLRVRAELALAHEPGQPPDHLFRNTHLLARGSVRRCIAALLLLCCALGGVLVMRPSELVRGAIEHEYYERTLHGSFMEAQPLLRHLGLGNVKAIPGFPQLMRPCDIEGHLVYHLTTFFDKGGMVTVFAFDAPVQIKEGAGWWGNVYWEVVSSREGKPLILVAQKKTALVAARASLAKSPA
jgi:hypothetical protein